MATIILPTAVPRHTEIVTRNVAEAQQFLTQAYGVRLRTGGTRDSSGQFTFRQTAAGQFTTARVQIPADLTLQADGRDEFVVSTLLSGTAVHDLASTTSRYQAGDVYLSVFPGAHFTSRVRQVHVHTVTLAASLLRAVADTALDEPEILPEFSRLKPVPGGALQWQRATHFVEGLLRDFPAADPAGRLVLGQAGRLLAATVLAVFPSTTVTGPSGTDQRDAHPATLRRAMSYIDAHPDQDITVADIAAAAFVTPRAVQLAFRRHLDTTPMAYLHRVRLEQAHHELLTADPERVTVTAVAYRWGFASPSRFAAEYRKAYGLLPSRTLRQG